MDFNFQESDFSKLLFPVHLMNDNTDPVKQFPKLKSWPEFKLKFSDVKKVQIFQWIAYVYDKESPFRSKIGDVIKRKIEAARYVKLIKTSSDYIGDIKELIENKNKEVNASIIAYVRMQRDSKFSLIIGLEQMFYDDLLKVTNGESIRRDLKSTQEQLESAALEFLNRDNNPFINEELFAYIEAERLSNLRPEGIADILALGKDPFEGEKIASETY